MLTLYEPETLWLNVINIALGVVTLVCLVVVAGVILQEALVRVRQRVRVPVMQDDHAFVVPELGLTMADGGERLDRQQAGQEAAPDEPNVIRSEN